MSVDTWLNDQEDHAVACALYGDCIFDVVQEGAQTLETRWKAVSRDWEKLLDDAVKTGFLGWGKPLVNRNWLLHVLFTPKLWPRSLSKEERKLLHLFVAAAGYHRLYARGVKREDVSFEKKDTDERTLVALQKLANLFKRNIAIPMWKTYNDVVSQYGQTIQPMCDDKYAEPCSSSEAEDIFKGDLRRGWKAQTLNVDPATYRTLGPFFDFVSA